MSSVSDSYPESASNFVFTVKETGSGEPYLLLELHEDIGLGDSTLAMHFERGTRMEQAQELASAINGDVERVRLTTA